MSVLLSESFLQPFRSGYHRVTSDGELSIHYSINNIVIYIMSFTFVSGRIFGQTDDTIVFVTRIQGVTDNFVSVRDATKSLKDISPPFALMAALEGFSKNLGIKTLIGMPHQKQDSEQHEDFAPVKDNSVFVALGATRITEFDTASTRSHVDYFRLPLPIPEKPITHVKRSHRSRAQAKRRIRKQISDVVHDVTSSMNT